MYVKLLIKRENRYLSHPVIVQISNDTFNSLDRP